MNPHLNSPAFPLDGENAPTGLTKREYAAIHIAAAFVSNSHHHPEEIALVSIRIADALLERLRYQPEHEPGAKSS